MISMRTTLSMVILTFLLVSWQPLLYAATNITTSWERTVTFKIVDSENLAALSKPLLIIKNTKHVEGSAEPIRFYDVVTGSVAGMADYQIDVKSEGAEVRAIVPGYVLSTRKVLWKDLPPREFDSFGLEKKFPVVTLALKPLAKASDWKRDFRLVVVPELEDLLQLKPPYLSKEEHRAINEFLNRERNLKLDF